MTYPRRTWFAAAIALGCVPSAVMAQQLAVPAITAMPNLPVNYQYQDWTATAQGFDSTVFNPTAHYQYPVFWFDPQSVNGVAGGFGMPSYVGQPASGPGEAITTISAVLGATLVGVDKHAQTLSNGQTYDFVLMASRYYDGSVGANMVLNNLNATTEGSFWYEQLPGILYYGIADKYYNVYAPGSAGQKRIDTVINGEAAKLHSVINVLAGGSSTAIPNFNYEGFNYATMQPVTGGHIEPDGAAGVGWLQYMAYQHTRNPTYLSDAERAMSFLNNLPATQNPLYEDILPVGTLAAARMNAEQGTHYDVGKMLNWCFAGGSPARPNWGVNTDAQWGGYGVAGLVGSINSYPFSMNTYDWGGALTPLVRYDPQYANAVGKWMLNLSNSARLFLKSGLPLNQQASGAWNDPPSNYYSYEGLHQTYNGITPYASGDASGVLEFAYGSGHVGMLGGVISATSVPEILQLNLLATDFFHDPNALPSYLFYNPYSIQKQVSFNVGAAPVDLYDTIAGKFVAVDVSGSVTVPISSQNSLSLVYVPHGGLLSDNGTHVSVGNSIVNYMSPELNRLYWNKAVAGSGEWDSTSPIWSDRNGAGAGMWAPGRTAVFPANSAGSLPYAVDVNGVQSISGLIFQGGTVTLSGGALNMAADTTIEADSGTQTINSTFEGPFNLIKTGAGTVNLGAVNSMTGITTIQQGAIQLGNPLALQDSLIDIETANGLDVHSLSATLGGLEGTGDLNIGSTKLTVGAANIDSPYSGSLTGTGGQLVKTGTAALELSGSNSYTGGTTVSGGVLRFTAAGSVPPSGSILIQKNGYAGANAAAAGANFAGFLSHVDGVNSTGTVGIESTIASDVNLTGFNPNLRLGSSLGGTLAGNFTPQGSTYRVGGGGGTLTIASALGDGAGLRSLDMGANGTQSAGIVVLAAANTYGGGTTINTGELSVAGESNLGAITGALTLNGGLLQVTGTQFNSISRPVSFISGGFNIADPTNTFTVNQNLAGGVLTKQGPGTLVLGGSNTQAGMNLAGGTLVADSAANLGNGTIQFNGMSTLQLNTSQNWSLANGLAFNTDGTINVAGTGAVTFAGGASGAGNLTFNGGALTLNGANSHSGTTTVNSGTLTLGAATGSSGDLYVNGGMILSRGNSSSNVFLGASSASGAAATFVLGQNGDALNQRVFYTGNTNALRIAGGANTFGTVSFTNWFDANGGTAYYTAAAGGTVSIQNIVDGSSAAVCKIGPGTVMITQIGANTGSASYSGNTTIRDGTLLLAANDFGTTTINASFPNGATNPNGNGGSLGDNAFSNAVQLGDSGTLAGDNIALLTGGALYVGHNLSVNAPNTAGTTTIGNAGTGDAYFAGNIALARSVTLTANPGATATFAGTLSGIGGVIAGGGGNVVLSNRNTYLGTTTVSAGSLQVTGSLAGNSSASVLVAFDSDGVFSDGIGDASITRRVSAGGSYTGFGSSIAAPAIVLPTTADLLAGPASAQCNLSMAWRVRTNSEPNQPRGLFSEVMDLAGINPNGTGVLDGSRQTDTFVLQMSYDPAIQGTLQIGYLDLGTDGRLGSADDRWLPAVGGNFGGTANFVGDGPYNASDFVLGNYGIDSADHVAWAVINHDGEFAVVPEPTSLLLVVAAVGLFARSRRPVRRSRDAANRS